MLKLVKRKDVSFLKNKEKQMFRGLHANSHQLDVLWSKEPPQQAGTQVLKELFVFLENDITVGLLCEEPALWCDVSNQKSNIYCALYGQF